MTITPTDNVDALIRQAQSIKNNNARIFNYWSNLHKEYEKNRIQEDIVDKNRELALQDKLYYEKAFDKSKMIKGTNVDLYI
jgi:hypothetical protein